MSSVPCINLPVYTRSGTFLGRVVDVELASATQEVAHYQVASSSLPLAGLWHKKLLIPKSQVVSISPEKMVVQDTTQSLPASAGASLAADIS